MSDYEAIAAQLLPVAASRTKQGASLTEIVGEFWKVYDLAAGLGAALSWLDEGGDNHPITVRNARVLSVGSPEQGVPIRWEETDRDGQTSERDANLGTLRNPAVRAVYDVARRLAGTGQECTLTVAYEPNDAGWETKDEKGKTIRPSHFRRIVRMAPVNGQRTEVPPTSEREREAVAVANPAPTPQPEQFRRAPQPEPEAPVAELPAHPAFARDGDIVGTLTKAQREDREFGLPDRTVAAYRAWWNTLDRAAQQTLRLANEAAGRPVPMVQDPETVGHLRDIALFARYLTATREPVPA